MKALILLHDSGLEETIKDMASMLGYSIVDIPDYLTGKGLETMGEGSVAVSEDSLKSIEKFYRKEQPELTFMDVNYPFPAGTEPEKMKVAKYLYKLAVEYNNKFYSVSGIEAAVETGKQIGLPVIPKEEAAANLVNILAGNYRV